MYLLAPPKGHTRRHTNLSARVAPLLCLCVAHTHARPTNPSDTLPTHTHDSTDHDSEEMIKLKEQATYKLGEVYGAIE